MEYYCYDKTMHVCTQRTKLNVNHGLLCSYLKRYEWDGDFELTKVVEKVIDPFPRMGKSSYDLQLATIQLATVKSYSGTEKSVLRPVFTLNSHGDRIKM